MVIISNNRQGSFHGAPVFDKHFACPPPDSTIGVPVYHQMTRLSGQLLCIIHTDGTACVF